MFCHFRKLENHKIFIGNNNTGYNETSLCSNLVHYLKFERNPKTECMGSVLNSKIFLFRQDGVSFPRQRLHSPLHRVQVIAMFVAEEGLLITKSPVKAKFMGIKTIISYTCRSCLITRISQKQ